MSDYVPVIGLEIHVELTTETKLFCRCPNTSSDLATQPNTAICPVCVGLPGALPVMNAKAVASTIKLGHSLGSRIPKTTKWDRKNYFYPDLPKGYQISQYDEPLCQGGELTLLDPKDGASHKIELTRIHLEEDTGKLLHPEGKDYSLIDYNRFGVPLLELVTEPALSSAEEARQFAEEYQHHLRDLGIAEAAMEKGQMRCEANVSIIPEAHLHDPEKHLAGTKVEIKNLNSFRSLERAIRHEVDRHIKALSEGRPLRQETRGWNEIKGETFVMRTKETAEDYRYFPEPDLGRLNVSNLKYGSDTTKDTEKIGVSRSYFLEQLLAQKADPELAHIVINDPKRRGFLKLLLEAGAGNLLKLTTQWLAQEPRLMEFQPEEVINGLSLLQRGVIRPSLFKEALMAAQPGGLTLQVETMKREETIENLGEVVEQVLDTHPAEVAQYKAGKQQLIGFFVGLVRKELDGKGDPTAIADTLRRKLE